MTKVTLTNDFHATRVTLNVPGNGIVSRTQVARAKHGLCGVRGCKCGGNLGERGLQSVEIEPMNDGSFRLTPKEPGLAD